MNGIDLKDHFSLTSSSEVDQICKSPLNSIGITYFNYIKIYDDGSRDLLTNHPSWIEHFYRNSLYKTNGIVDIEYLLPKGYFLWSELKNNDIAYAQGRESFNIDNGISFVIKKEGMTILYIFASTRDNYTINNFYVRNIDLLKRFMLYFADKGNKLIKKSSENKIVLPEKQIINSSKINKIHISDQIRNEFLLKTDIERFFLPNCEEGSYLTRREAECAVCLLSGATAKQIAQSLGISFRTVETHFQQIKEKLKCSSKEDLIKILISSNIHDVVMHDKK